MKERIEELCFTRKDFRVDTFRGSGKGGQHRNKTDSAVRITHKETGICAESCEQRSQGQNKEEAFRKLAKKLMAHFVPKVNKERFQAGQKRIRTYNFSDNTIKDSETKRSYSADDTWNKGSISDIIMDRSIDKQIQEN